MRRPGMRAGTGPERTLHGDPGRRRRTGERRGRQVSATVIASGIHSSPITRATRLGTSTTARATNGQPNQRRLGASVRIDREPPRIAFRPPGPERTGAIEARVSDRSPGPDPVRRVNRRPAAGSGERFGTLADARSTGSLEPAGTPTPTHPASTNSGPPATTAPATRDQRARVDGSPMASQPAEGARDPQRLARRLRGSRAVSATGPDSRLVGACSRCRQRRCSGMPVRMWSGSIRGRPDRAVEPGQDRGRRPLLASTSPPGPSREVIAVRRPTAR